MLMLDGLLGSMDSEGYTLGLSGHKGIEGYEGWRYWATDSAIRNGGGSALECLDSFVLAGLVRTCWRWVDVRYDRATRSRVA